jgi:hypothetical protein
MIRRRGELDAENTCFWHTRRGTRKSRRSALLATTSAWGFWHTSQPRLKRNQKVRRSQKFSRIALTTERATSLLRRSSATALSSK